MSMTILAAILFSAPLCLCGSIPAAEDTNPVKAKVSDISWMAGAWSGPGLGGQTEEHWTAPAGGSMLGMFRLVNKDDVATVFELMLIEQEGEYVKYRFRHFGPGHKPLGKPDKPLEFDLIEVSENKAVFHSSVQTYPKRITYRRVGDDELRIHVQGEKDGKLGAGFELALTRETGASSSSSGAGSNVQFFLAQDEPQDGYRKATLELHAETVYLSPEPCLTGNDIASVKFEYDKTGRPGLMLQFTEIGARRLARVTRENLRRRLAIVVADRVLLAPRIEDEIKGGAVRLTGAFTREYFESIRRVIESP